MPSDFLDHLSLVGTLEVTGNLWKVGSRGGISIAILDHTGGDLHVSK